MFHPPAFEPTPHPSGVVLHAFANVAVDPPGIVALVLFYRPFELALVAVGFALAAHRLRGASVSGATAGGALSFLILFSSGVRGFALVVIVFALATLSTRMGHTRKWRLGIAENKHGRTARQVLANLSVAAGCAVLARVLNTWQPLFQLGMVAALAEAASDTVASEFGQAFGHRAYLITTFARVRPGTDGGISLAGTVAAAAAAGIVALAAAWMHLLPTSWLGAATGAGFFGMIADSLLGATLQRRGWLNNSAVNFFGTLVAAGLAILLV